MNEARGLYDASVTDAGASFDLDHLLSAGTEQALRTRLDALHETVLRTREAEAGAPLDPEIVTALEQATSADGAPVEFQSLLRRVQAGRLTWEQVWHSPGAESGGYRLVAAVTYDLVCRPPAPPVPPPEL